MNLDPTAMPATLDLLHFVLAGLVLVLVVVLIASRGAAATARAQRDEALAAAERAAKTKPAPVSHFKEATPDAALQLLALLQQNARFIDFLQEDLSGYDDTQIGAAARVVHEGGQKTLEEYFSLAPVRTEAEESRITLNEGFDASQIRLTGNVVGKPPFTGTLVHRGWKVVDAKLPKLSKDHDIKIVAPAEVEL
jgi:hypothetical protein